MAMQVLDPGSVASASDRLAYARQIIRGEAAALEQVAERLDDAFLQTVDLFYRCAGRVCITGTGKSADVGQKIAGTLNSTGTRAYVLDATRAMHGDLGMVHPHDVVLALSHSGESEEIVRLLPSLRQLATGLVALTGNGQSTLAREADVAIVLGPLEEVCPLGLAPTQHHGHDRRRRRAGLRAERCATSRTKTSPAFTRPAAWGQAAQGRSRHAPRRRTAAGRPRGDGPCGVCPVPAGGRRTGAVMLIDADGNWSACSPTATWPVSSSSAATPPWIGPSGKS